MEIVFILRYISICYLSNQPHTALLPLLSLPAKRLEDGAGGRREMVGVRRKVETGQGGPIAPKT